MTVQKLGCMVLAWKDFALWDHHIVEVLKPVWCYSIYHVKNSNSIFFWGAAIGRATTAYKSDWGNNFLLRWLFLVQWMWARWSRDSLSTNLFLLHLYSSHDSEDRSAMIVEWSLIWSVRQPFFELISRKLITYRDREFVDSTYTPGRQQVSPACRFNFM